MMSWCVSNDVILCNNELCLDAELAGYPLDSRRGARVESRNQVNSLASRADSSSMNQSQLELTSLQYGGLDVRTRQGLAARDEAGSSGRCPAAVPTGKVGWLVLKSAARVPRLGYPADGPCGSTDITELIVCSIKSAARQAQPCRFECYERMCSWRSPDVARSALSSQS